MPNMENPKKELLRKVLIAGSINTETSDRIKNEIFIECHMDKTKHKHRALWSAWITCKSVPNRFCQVAINSVLQRNNIESIYD